MSMEIDLSGYVSIWFLLLCRCDEVMDRKLGSLGFCTGSLGIMTVKSQYPPPLFYCFELLLCGSLLLRMFEGRLCLFSLVLWQGCANQSVLIPFVFHFASRNCVRQSSYR